jgi:hypothetical protein
MQFFQNVGGDGNAASDVAKGAVDLAYGAADFVYCDVDVAYGGC